MEGFYYERSKARTAHGVTGKRLAPRVLHPPLLLRRTGCLATTKASRVPNQNPSFCLMPCSVPPSFYSLFCPTLGQFIRMYAHPIKYQQFITVHFQDNPLWTCPFLRQFFTPCHLLTFAPGQAATPFRCIHASLNVIRSITNTTPTPYNKSAVSINP